MCRQTVATRCKMRRMRRRSIVGRSQTVGRCRPAVANCVRAGVRRRFDAVACRRSLGGCKQTVGRCVQLRLRCCRLVDRRIRRRRFPHGCASVVSGRAFRASGSSSPDSGQTFVASGWSALASGWSSRASGRRLVADGWCWAAGVLAFAAGGGRSAASSRSVSVSRSRDPVPCRALAVGGWWYPASCDPVRATKRTPSVAGSPIDVGGRALRAGNGPLAVACPGNGAGGRVEPASNEPLKRSYILNGYQGRKVKGGGSRKGAVLGPIHGI